MALKLHTKSHGSNADTGEISMTAQKRRVDNPDPDDDGNNWIVIVGTFSNRPNTCANAIGDDVHVAVPVHTTRKNRP